MDLFGIYMKEKYKGEHMSKSQVGMILLVFCLVVVCMSVPTFYLWNWLMPIIFGLKEITIWQALGLNILCTILFKGNYSSK